MNTHSQTSNLQGDVYTARSQKSNLDRGAVYADQRLTSN